jgi:hypothetical protein
MLRSTNDAEEVPEIVVPADAREMRSVADADAVTSSTGPPEAPCDISRCQNCSDLAETALPGALLEGGSKTALLRAQTSPVLEPPMCADADQVHLHSAQTPGLSLSLLSKVSTRAGAAPARGACHNI